MEYKCFTGIYDLYSKKSTAQRTSQIYKYTICETHLSYVLSIRKIITVIRDALWQVSDFLHVFIILIVYYTEQFKSSQDHAYP